MKPENGITLRSRVPLLGVGAACLTLEYLYLVTEQSIISETEMSAATPNLLTQDSLHERNVWRSNVQSLFLAMYTQAFLALPTLPPY